MPRGLTHPLQTSANAYGRGATLRTSVTVRASQFVIVASCAMQLSCGAGRTELGSHSDVDATAVSDGAVTIACGSHTCDGATEYCRQVAGGPPPGVHLQECKALPASCHACLCLHLDVGCNCISTDTTGVTVSCNVP